MGSGAGCLLGNDSKLAPLSSERVGAAILRETKLNGALARTAFAFVRCSGTGCELLMQ